MHATQNPATTLAAALAAKADIAQTSVHARQDTLAALAGERRAAETLSDRLNDLAKAEGRYDLLLSAAKVAEYHEAHEDDDVADAVRNYMLDRMTEGAGDTWSGRGNDVRRARHEGLLDAAREINLAIEMAR